MVALADYLAKQGGHAVDATRRRSAQIGPERAVPARGVQALEKKGKRSPYLRSKILFQRSSTIGEQQSAMNIWELDHLKTQLELHLFR